MNAAQNKPPQKAPDMSDEQDHKGHPFRWLQRSFVTGVVIAAPIGITIYLTLAFIGFVDDRVIPLIPDRYNPETYLPFSVPGLGVLVAVIALTVLGALTANLFGRTLIGYGERLVDRMPVVRNLYNALKQIFETVVSHSEANFTEVGLIEYPRKGLYAVCFVTTSTGGEIQARAEHDLVSVFLPTTPNPTSGFLLFVPRQDIQILSMSVEEAAKLIISAGLVEPGSEEQVPQVDPATVGAQDKPKDQVAAE